MLMLPFELRATERRLWLTLPAVIGLCFRNGELSSVVRIRAYIGSSSRRSYWLRAHAGELVFTGLMTNVFFHFTKSLSKIQAGKWEINSRKAEVCISTVWHWGWLVEFCILYEYRSISMTRSASGWQRHWRKVRAEGATFLHPSHTEFLKMLTRWIGLVVHRPT